MTKLQSIVLGKQAELGEKLDQGRGLPAPSRLADPKNMTKHVTKLLLVPAQKLLNYRVPDGWNAQEAQLPFCQYICIFHTYVCRSLHVK